MRNFVNLKEENVNKMRVTILQNLYNQIAQRIEQSKTIVLYGTSYPAEELVQIWDITPKRGLVEVGRARRENNSITFEIDSEDTDISIIPYHTEFISRTEGIVDTTALTAKQVALVGLGSVGSNLAVYLAQSSVGQFCLIDIDTLSASNISRHACNSRDLGRHKTKALRDLILYRNPKAVIETFEEDFLKLTFDDQVERLRGSNLVIASTDSNAAQFMVNDVCRYLGIPSLYVGCYERACAGEIVFVIPSKTPCFNCIMEFRQSTLGEINIKERRMPYTNEDPSGLKAEPGLAIDIGYVTTVAASYALAVLEPDSSRNVLLDPERNLILVHSGNQPHKKYAEIFRMPFDLVFCKVRRDEACEVCGKE